MVGAVDGGLMVVTPTPDLDCDATPDDHADPAIGVVMGPGITVTGMVSVPAVRGQGRSGEEGGCGEGEKHVS